VIEVRWLTEQLQEFGLQLRDSRTPQLLDFVQEPKSSPQWGFLSLSQRGIHVSMNAL